MNIGEDARERLWLAASGDIRASKRAVMKVGWTWACGWSEKRDFIRDENVDKEMHSRLSKRHRIGRILTDRQFENEK